MNPVRGYLGFVLFVLAVGVLGSTALWLILHIARI